MAVRESTPVLEPGASERARVDGEGARPRTSAWARATSHPILTTTLVGILVAVVNAWWVHSHRRLGAYNVDEAGYLGYGLTLHRTLDLSDPIGIIRMAAAPMSTGPLVPWLSVPFIALFGRNAFATM